LQRRQWLMVDQLFLAISQQQLVIGCHGCNWGPAFVLCFFFAREEQSCMEVELHFPRICKCLDCICGIGTWLNATTMEGSVPRLPPSPPKQKSHIRFRHQVQVPLICSLTRFLVNPPLVIVISLSQCICAIFSQGCSWKWRLEFKVLREVVSAGYPSNPCTIVLCCFSLFVVFHFLSSDKCCSTAAIYFSLVYFFLSYCGASPVPCKPQHQATGEHAVLSMASGFHQYHHLISQFSFIWWTYWR